MAEQCLTLPLGPLGGMLLVMGKVIQPCKIDGCHKAAKNSGMCWGHYSRNRKHGDPLSGRTAEGVPMQFLLRAIAADQSGCIDWPYSVSGTGRPVIWHNGRMEQAARVVLNMTLGPPPTDKHFALHSPIECHNQNCINPRHLRWGTPSENNADMFLDGTACVGMRNAQCKLSDDDIRAIRASSVRSVELAGQFGISERTVRKIRARHARNQPWI